MGGGGNLMDGCRKPVIHLQTDIVKVDAGDWKNRETLLPVGNVPRELPFDEGACFFLYPGKLKQFREQEKNEPHEGEERQEDEKQTLSF